MLAAQLLRTQPRLMFFRDANNLLFSKSASLHRPLLGGHDEPETLSYQIALFGPISADVRQYWWFVLFVSLGGFAAGIIDGAMFPYGDAALFAPLFVLATLFPSYAVAWRRLHDTDHSGWWIGGTWLAALPLGLIVAGLEAGVLAAIGFLA